RRRCGELDFHDGAREVRRPATQVAAAGSTYRSIGDSHGGVQDVLEVEGTMEGRLGVLDWVYRVGLRCTRLRVRRMRIAGARASGEGDGCRYCDAENPIHVRGPTPRQDLFQVV